MGARRRSWSGVPARAVGVDDDVTGLARRLPDAVAAERIAAILLADDPARLRHVRTAAGVALIVSETVAPRQLDLLLSAVVLHDIGYAPAVRATGWHPVDGAQWLLSHGAPVEVAALVAHHSESGLLSAARPWLDRLAVFPAPDEVVADVVTYADQTTAPDGRRVSPIARIVDRRRRRPPLGTSGWTDERRRTERLVHAVARVHVRLHVAGSQDPYLTAVDHLATSVMRAGAADEEIADRVRAVLPDLGPGGGLDPDGRVRAAVAAARALAVVGPDPHYVDPVVTACRLLVPSRSATAAATRFVTTASTPH